MDWSLNLSGPKNCELEGSGKNNVRQIRIWPHIRALPSFSKCSLVLSETNALGLSNSPLEAVQRPVDVYPVGALPIPQP